MAELQIPFVAGLAQDTSSRVRQPPGLTVCKDVEFDHVGDLNTRFPFAAAQGGILGGGALANTRRVVANGDELLCFTKDTLYSWNAQQAKWVSKGTHLAIKVREQSRFVTTDDQITADRAELNGTIVYAWTSNTTTYVAAIDKATGSVLMAPTAIAGAALRPRLVALTTKILLFFHDNLTSLLAYALDPANPAAALGGASTTVLGGGASNQYYDAVASVAKDAAFVAIRRQVTTSYEVVKITEALAITRATKARTCDGPIAIAVGPAGNFVQIVRGNGTNVQGDLLNAATLADVFVAQAIGTVPAGVIKQITAAFRSVQNGGQYRCYAFWDHDESIGNGWASKSNWVDTGNALGAQANFVRCLGVASRAFDYAGSVYVWGVFAGRATAKGLQLQNTHYLYRDDAFLCAKTAPGRSGGFAAATGHLPNVDGAAGVYSWCSLERRIVPTGDGGANYAARAPRDVTFAFDSNEARRCVRLGKTLYITGGEILQYDGARLVEVGFHVFPWDFDINTIEIGTGAMAAGTYSYKSTYRWDNAQGELDRSTTATMVNQAVTDPLPSGVAIPNASPLYITHKTANPPAVEYWRSKVNPNVDDPFYLVTSKDPAVVANPNRYVANDPTASLLPTFNDELADASATTHEEFPETGAVLPNLAPPPATIIAASEERLFLAGISDSPDQVWYSKLRGDEEVAAFHGALVVEVPPAGGDITALALLDGTLVVFREAAIYALPGEGFDNTAGGSNYGPARIISSDVGAVSHEAVALTPAGLVFKSSKGRYLLGRDFSVTYIGGPVKDYDGDTDVAVHVVEGKHQVRWLTSARMLVHDYRPGVNQWSEWSIADGLHACIWQGVYTYLAAAGTRAEQAAYAALTYGLDVEMSWVRPNDLQGKGRIRLVDVLGEFRSACAIRVRLARDYDDAYFYDKTWTVTPQNVGGPLEFSISPTIQQVQAMKVRLTAVKGGAQATLLAGADLQPFQLDRLSGGVWTATLEAIPKGAAGNAVTISIGVRNSGAAAWSLELKDGQEWDPSTQTWSALANNIGIKLLGKTGSAPTVQHVEALINAYSRLATVATPDATPAAVIDVEGILGGLPDRLATAAFAGGVDADNNTAPTGEALKLSALSFDIVPTPGLNRRLPAAQKT